ncbi:hypothetical protein [Cupriavidus basilensis]|uniref:hypothetical protein n=1 Tax=Cupriavidus basilensis TaxID=68895 RepID=UPI0020A61FA3|nr:hypothetical protein [Cupriavidus basilensis]MCP3022287.1 hypothetical protein [Cupriavidus basilensis]
MRKPKIAAGGLLWRVDPTRQEAGPAATANEPDAAFLVSRMVEKGIAKRAPLKRRRVAQYASKRAERDRQEAEEAARNVMRHRVAANEKRYPEILAQVRGAEFLAWYQRAAGEPWDPGFEADVEEIRYRVLLAQQKESSRRV